MLLPRSGGLWPVQDYKKKKKERETGGDLRANALPFSQSRIEVP